MKMKNLVNDEAKQELYKHIRADGPIGIDNCVKFMREQVNDQADALIVSNMLTALIRDYRVELYDDGQSFVVADLEYDEQGQVIKE
jgi:hypothetical protein